LRVHELLGLLFKKMTEKRFKGREKGE